MLGRVKVFHRRADADGELFDEAGLQSFDPGLSGHETAEEFSRVIAERRNDP
jgi:hypothetical protein